MGTVMQALTFLTLIPIIFLFPNRDDPTSWLYHCHAHFDMPLRSGASVDDAKIVREADCGPYDKCGWFCSNSGRTDACVRNEPDGDGWRLRPVLTSKKTAALSNNKG